LRLLRRPLVRLALWAAIIVAVAVVVHVAGLAWWWILVCVFGTWLLLTALERRIDRAGRGTAASAEEAVTAEPEPEQEQKPAVAEAVAEKPEPLTPPAAPEPRPAVPPAPPAPPPAVAVVPVNGRRWSIWDLDRAARESADAGLRFLVLSLQDYADADGTLPPQFDPLVRESFGALLAVPAVAP
jgi:hypothetical protein